MTIDEAIRHIYKVYDQETDDPDQDSDDYAVRMAKINEAIGIWENEDGVLWNELFATATGTTADQDSDYSAPSGFVFPAGYLRLYNASGQPILFEKKTPQDYQVIEKYNSARKIYYITGGDRAKVININPVPTTSNELAGLSYKLNYYSHAYTYSSGNDTTPIQMSDPWYVIHYTLSYLYADDENITQANLHAPIATQKLKAMVARNDISTWFESDVLPDTNDTGFGL